jgi:hypothetical protein
MLGRVNIGFVGLILLTLPAFAEGPEWATRPPRQEGGKLLVACHGIGPDRDVAIRLAVDQCKALATQQLSSDFQVKSLSVETEQMAAYHEEVTASHNVSGLTCDIQKQYEAKINDSQEAWVQCRIDIAKAKIEPENKFSANVQNDTSDRHIDKKEIVQSQNKQLIVSSIPACQSVLISGKLTRVMRCVSNPMTVMVEPSDKEIVIRAEGYQPKHVTLSGDRKLATETESVDVYLERQ